MTPSPRVLASTTAVGWMSHFRPMVLSFAITRHGFSDRARRIPQMTSSAARQPGRRRTPSQAAAWFAHIRCTQWCTVSTGWRGSPIGVGPPNTAGSFRVWTYSSGSITTSTGGASDPVTVRIRVNRQPASAGSTSGWTGTVPSANFERASTRTAFRPAAPATNASGPRRW